MSSKAKTYDDGTPVMEVIKVGGVEREIVPKDVHAETLHCPNHDIPLRYDENGDAVCPDPACPIINPGNATKRNVLERTPADSNFHDDR
jgi:hypothetical protein